MGEKLGWIDVLAAAVEWHERFLVVAAELKAAEEARDLFMNAWWRVSGENDLNIEQFEELVAQLRVGVSESVAEKRPVERLRLIEKLSSTDHLMRSKASLVTFLEEIHDIARGVSQPVNGRKENDEARNLTD